jgi:hypothetical protein
MLDKKKTAVCRLAGIALVLLCAGCVSPAVNAGTTLPGGKAGPEEKIILKSILERPKAFTGKEITIEGVFLGWSGVCPRSRGLTRSDWMLEDGSGCIYVTGRLPSGVFAGEPQKERLRVTGTVKTAKDGKPFLQAASVKVLP